MNRKQQVCGAAVTSRDLHVFYTGGAPRESAAPPGQSRALPGLCVVSGAWVPAKRCWER